MNKNEVEKFAIEGVEFDGGELKEIADVMGHPGWRLLCRVFDAGKVNALNATLGSNVPIDHITYVFNHAHYQAAMTPFSIEKAVKDLLSPGKEE